MLASYIPERAEYFNRIPYLLHMQATCLAAPLRLQREVITDVTVVTKTPSGEYLPQLMKCVNNCNCTHN